MKLNEFVKYVDSGVLRIRYTKSGIQTQFDIGIGTIQNWWICSALRKYERVQNWKIVSVKAISQDAIEIKIKEGKNDL